MKKEKMKKMKIGKKNIKLLNKDYYMNILSNKFIKKIKKRYSTYKFIIILLFILLFIFFMYFIFFSKNIFKEVYNSNIFKKNNFTNNFKVEDLKYNESLFSFFENRLKNLQNSSIDWPLPKEIKFKPVMNEIEIKNFLSFMKKDNIYFEFGSGGSTNIVSYYNLKAYSVESDIKWHNKLRNEGINVNYLTVDLKSTGMGYPGKNTSVKDWKKYIQSYKSEYNADIILIDGRFRVACALDIFSKIKYDTLVLIHDYDRPYYHIIENYYIKIREWKTLAAFFKNPNVSSIPENIYNKYIYIPK